MEMKKTLIGLVGGAVLYGVASITALSPAYVQKTKAPEPYIRHTTPFESQRENLKDFSKLYYNVQTIGSVSAQETKASEPTEQTQQKTMVQDIEDCVGGIKDFGPIKKIFKEIVETRGCFPSESQREDLKDFSELYYNVQTINPVSAQETKAPEPTEQTQQKTMVQDIGECVNALKDYVISFQEQEATQCLVNYTNPDALTPIGAPLQAVECGVRATIDYIRHTTPSESQRKVLEDLTAVYDDFQTVRRMIEHPHPNAELMYKAADELIERLDRRSQNLAKIANKECAEAEVSILNGGKSVVRSVYNTGKSVFESTMNDPDLAGNIESIMNEYEQRLEDYLRTTPVHDRSEHMPAVIMELAKDKIKNELKNKAQDERDIESIVQEPNTNAVETFRQRVFEKPLVHEGVTPDQYIRTNDLYNQNRVERGLAPMESRGLDPSNVDEVRRYNEILGNLKESDSNQTKNDKAPSSQDEGSSLGPIHEPQIPKPSTPTRKPVDSAGRTPKENKEIDKGFHKENPDAPRRLDPNNPDHKKWIEVWVDRAKKQDREK